MKQTQFNNLVIISSIFLCIFCFVKHFVNAPMSSDKGTQIYSTKHSSDYSIRENVGIKSKSQEQYFLQKSDLKYCCSEIGQTYESTVDCYDYSVDCIDSVCEYEKP